MTGSVARCKRPNAVYLKKILGAIRPGTKVPSAHVARAELLVHIMLQLDAEPFDILRQAGGTHKYPKLSKPSLTPAVLRDAVYIWVKYHPQPQYRQLCKELGHVARKIAAGNKKRSGKETTSSQKSYAEMWLYLKRAVLQDLGLHVIQTPAYRVYFEDNAARPHLTPAAHAHMREGRWREAVRCVSFFQRTAEDDDLEQERKSMYVASAAFEHAMGGQDEVNLPADAHALDCPDVQTREEWDALWPYEEHIRKCSIQPDGLTLPEIPAEDERLRWVMPHSKGGVTRAELQNVMRAQGKGPIGEEEVSLEQLNPTQRAFADMALRWQERVQAARVLKDPERYPEPHFRAILLGTAGTGKTTTLKAMLSELSRRGGPEWKYCVGAYTGVAAANVGLGARTLHDLFKLSRVNEASGELMPLDEEDMKEMAGEMKGMELLVIDEMSMVSRVVLAQVHARLREWRQHEGKEDLASEPFGGLAVVLAGDMGQLPPIAVSPSFSLLNGQTIHGAREQAIANHGLRLFKKFNTVVRLRRIHRQKGASPYKDSLINLRDGAMSEADHALWATHDMSAGSQTCTFSAEERQVFEDEAVHLFAENAPAGARNGYKAGRLAETSGRTILRVASRDTSQSAAKERNDNYNNLRRVVHLVHGAPVMLIANLRTELGLVNGTVGKLMSAVLKPDAESDDGGIRDAVHVDKVRYLIVDVPGYGGPAFWPDHPTWVPVPPIQVRHSKNKKWFRTQLPLTLAWGMTIHKSQGLTFKVPLVLDFQHKPNYQPVARLGLAFVGMSRCTDFARMAFRNLPGFGEFRKVLQDQMHGWRSAFETAMDARHDACMNELFGRAWTLEEDVAAHVQWSEAKEKRTLTELEVADIHAMLKVRGLLVLEGYQDPPARAPGLQGGGGKKRSMGMAAPQPAKRARTVPPNLKRHLEPGTDDAPRAQQPQGGLTSQPPQSRPCTHRPQHQLMMGGTAPTGWFSTLLGRHVGRPVPAPSWFNSALSGAVSGGVQAAATCGLHALNHCLHPLGRVISWEDFDGRAEESERTAYGDWDAAVLHRNALVCGADMRPVFPQEYEALARWHGDMGRLGLWGPETLGCVAHVPGHWIALTRPLGTQDASNAACLCDSLHRRPFALSADDVRQLFGVMAAEQRRQGEPLLQRITMQVGLVAH